MMLARAGQRTKSKLLGHKRFQSRKCSRLQFVLPCTVCGTTHPGINLVQLREQSRQLVSALLDQLLPRPFSCRHGLLRQPPFARHRPEPAVLHRRLHVELMPRDTRRRGGLEPDALRVLGHDCSQHQHLSGTQQTTAPWQESPNSQGTEQSDGLYLRPRRKLLSPGSAPRTAPPHRARARGHDSRCPA